MVLERLRDGLKDGGTQIMLPDTERHAGKSSAAGGGAATATPTCDAAHDVLTTMLDGSLDNIVRYPSCTRVRWRVGAMHSCHGFSRLSWLQLECHGCNKSHSTPLPFFGECHRAVRACTGTVCA